VWVLSDRAFSVFVSIVDAVVPARCAALLSPESADVAAGWGWGWMGSGVARIAGCAWGLLLYLAAAVVLAWAGLAGWALWAGSAFLLVRATLGEVTAALAHPGVGTVALSSLLVLFAALLVGLAAHLHRRMLLRHVHTKLDDLDIRGDKQLPRPEELRVDVLLSRMASRHRAHALIIDWCPAALLALAVLLGLLVGDTMACSGRLLCLEGIGGAAESVRQIADVVASQLVAPPARVV